MDPRRLSTFGDDHLMVFYESADALFEHVSSFLARGLHADHPAIVIATTAHQRGVLDSLRAKNVNVDAALASSRLMVVDAPRVLSRIVRNGGVDADVFARCISPIFRQLATGAPAQPPFVYGEVVDLLWKARRVDEALALEVLWNDLLTRQPMTLLCGYSMQEFSTQSSYVPALLHQHTSAILPGRC